MSDVMPRLTKVFQEVFDDPALTLKAETTAADVEDWDSLNHINLVIAVEQEFDMEFSARQIAKLANVGEFVQMIESKLGS